MSRFARGVRPIIAIAVLLLTSLWLMSEATQGSARFGELFSVLLVINVIGLVALAALIGWNLFRLLRQVHHRRAGARLTARMVVMFAILAVAPMLVVYYFSLQFLHRGIESWFDVRIESALEDALELSRTSLGVRMRELLSQTELTAGDLIGVPDDQTAALLDDARRLSGATEVSLFGPKGQIIASSNVDPSAIVPDRPSDTILVQLRQSGNYIGLDPIGRRGLFVRVVVSVPDEVPTGEPRVLQALFPVAERMSTLADSVESAYGQYRELAYLREPLKVSFTLTLSLVLLVSLFTAVWAAFWSARRMVAPLRDLAEGTEAVASGDLETQLPESGADEVGFLVESFNEMTRELKRARDATRTSQQQVEAQRAYLAAVLTRLSTGVMTFDSEGTIVTANEAAAQILGLDPERAAGLTLAAAAAREPELVPLAEVVGARLATAGDDADGGVDWRDQIVLARASGRQVLICSGTPLAGGDGHVLVFDDVTELIRAQRNAAWSEVARRLAHEIKNPLTPIQLSAERLRHKYLGRMAPDDSELLDRLTRTIVQQVESMKEMVNAFSDYSRTPSKEPTTIDLNALIADVLELYRGGDAGHALEQRLDDRVPAVEADPDRLRQVMHNLVKNALEASPEAAEVTVETRATGDAPNREVELRVSDRGPGFQPEMLDRLFEPYVTTKQKGTGLGLAIVKKIVEEHGGSVSAENDPRGGACIVVRLPAASAEPAHAPAREAGSAA